MTRELHVVTELYTRPYSYSKEAQSSKLQEQNKENLHV